MSWGLRSATIHGLAAYRSGHPPGACSPRPPPWRGVVGGQPASQVANVVATLERFTEQARHTLTLAKDEACLLHHSFIGTEHILLGLAREGGGVGAQALHSFGISHEAVREKVVEALGISGSVPDASPPFTPRAKKVLELSLREALLLDHSDIGTEHILLGLIREGNGVAAAVLRSLGAEPYAIRQEVVRLMTGGEEPSAGASVSGSRSETEGALLRLTPCCPRCRASIAEVARFRTIFVDADAERGDREPLPIDVVYCRQCGTTLHMFRREDPR